MSQVQSLILLVNSMTLPEKKAFRTNLHQGRSKPNYFILYNTLEKNGALTVPELRRIFMKERPGASLETSARYLYDLIINSLLYLRRDQDSFYTLYNMIFTARVLFEKSLFTESFKILNEVMTLAEKYENYDAFLLASRLELEYLLALNFPNTTEKMLLKKQFRLNESLKYLRKVNEEASLFEILKHRIIYKGYPRSPKQKNELNDLVFSELSMVASQRLENFQIRKLHQLFQSTYLISVGDYKSAVHSYYELNSLFESNEQLWSHPPVYYVDMLEGVLESLRSIRNYKNMNDFIVQLKKIKSPSVDFKLNLTCLIFQYELFPFLDRGDFNSCLKLITHYKGMLFDKFQNLNRVRQAELCLYASLVYIGLSEFRKAHKFMNQLIIKGKNFSFLPLFRTIRLVNLIILYHLGESDLIRYEIRSMKRELSGSDKGYKIERLMFRFLSRMPVKRTTSRIKQWEKVKGACQDMHQDIFEQQILRIFDFTAWIESQILKIPLSEVLAAKMKELEVETS